MVMDGETNKDVGPYFKDSGCRHKNTVASIGLLKASEWFE
jgi:hypothetical protein